MGVRETAFWGDYIMFVEMCLCAGDLAGTEENGNTLLKSRQGGKSDGRSANFSVSEYYPENKAEEIKKSIAKAPGDTVSTDIIELTVNKAELSYYADTTCSASETSGVYTANKGRTLLCLDFTLRNTDRSSLNTSDYLVNFYVNQNGESVLVKGYDINNEDGCYGLMLFNMPLSVNGGVFVHHGTSNEIIRAGDSIQVKYVGIIKMDADLSEPFELMIDIVNSDDNRESFLYIIE